MFSENVTLRWNVSDVFRIIFNNDAPTIFANHFDAATAEEKECWRKLCDGMHQDFLGQALSLGKRQWVEWFLHNDWPVFGRKSSLITALVRQEKTIHDKRFVDIEDPVHLVDVMDMMSNTQWDRFCSSWRQEDTEDLVCAVKDWKIQTDGTPLEMSRFLNALHNNREKHDILKDNIWDVARMCKQHIYWLDGFERLGWDIQRLTQVWENPLIDCVGRMLLGDAKTVASAHAVVSSQWFKKVLGFPSSHAALSTTNTHDPDCQDSVWPQLLQQQTAPEVALLITQRLLTEVDWTAKQMEDLQTTVEYCERTAGTTLCGETVRSFLSKQIITDSLKNSVKSENSSEKKPFKKM